MALDASRVTHPAAIDLLVEDRSDDDLPGVLGPVEHAKTFAERWTAREGLASRLHASKRTFRLTKVIPPPPVTGQLRIPTPDDGDLIAAWMQGVHGRRVREGRSGPVYTPPAARRRGYASALVAEASQLQLDAGRRFRFLFTDLANPTSNHIYQTIGYEPGQRRGRTSV